MRKKNCERKVEKGEMKVRLRFEDLVKKIAVMWRVIFDKEKTRFQDSHMDKWTFLLIEMRG